MKVFFKPSEGPSYRLSKEMILNNCSLSSLEREVLLMFHSWVKVGFIVEYSIGGNEQSLHEKMCDPIIIYSILFVGTNKHEYRILIGALERHKDSENYNVTDVVHATKELMQKFFNAVAVAEKQNLE